MGPLALSRHEDGTSVCRAVTVCRAIIGAVIATIESASLVGLETYAIDVEVDLRRGAPSFAIVGLPDTAVQEARERVRSGLSNQGYEVPKGRIVANLAPADLKKIGPQFDLPIALSLLAASAQLKASALRGVVAVGELALDGSLRSIPGVLAIAQHAAERGMSRVLVPAANALEASLVEGIEAIGARTLREAVESLLDVTTITSTPVNLETLSGAPPPVPDIADVRGATDRASRARNQRRRLSLPADDGATRGREDDARPAPPGAPTTAQRERGHRDHTDSIGGRNARPCSAACYDAPIPCAPSFDLCRGSCRWREGSSTW